MQVQQAGFTLPVSGTVISTTYMQQVLNHLGLTVPLRISKRPTCDTARCVNAVAKLSQSSCRFTKAGQSFLTASVVGKLASGLSAL